MNKLIIQSAKKYNHYFVVLLQQQKFLFLSWWKEVSIMTYEGETAFSKSLELIEKHDIQSGDGFVYSSVRKAS